MVWDAISRSHGFASKSHSGPENLEIAKNSAKYEETSNNQFITAKLIKLICEETSWVQCQFQSNISVLRKLTLQTRAQISKWLLIVQNSRAKQNRKMTSIRLWNLNNLPRNSKKYNRGWGGGGGALKR